MQKLSMDQLNRVDIESFKQLEKTPIILVLDNVRSMHNVGSAFRTADGFAIEELILCGITATPPHREIEKTALGATQSVAWTHYNETTEAVKKLQEKGYKVMAIEQAQGSISLEQFEIEAGTKYAFVFGNEVHGVDDEVMEMVDGCIEIPQFGTKHSFNVSVTMGIVTWDVLKKIKF